MKTTAAMTAAFLGLSLTAFAQAPAKVTYTEHILPIFRNACTNCHNPDKKKAGLDLTTYQAAMTGSDNGPVLRPGNPAGSLLFKVVTHADEPKMPPKGDKLSDADLALIKGWIAGFALENANSKPAQATQNKVDVAVISLSKPDGPPPMPGDLPLEPFVKSRASNSVVAMASSPWAPLLAIGGQKQVLLYNTETLEPLGVLAFPEGFPNVIRFSKNAKLLLAGGGLGGKIGKVVLWDVATGQRIGVVGNEADSVLSADISPDQQFVALGGPNKQVKIYSTKDGKQTGLIKKHTDWVTAVAYSPDGKYLATADRNGGVELWEAGREPKPFNTLPGHKVACTALAFMPGVLASASEDGKVSLWNVKEGTEIRSWTAHAGGVLWADFTPDGRLVSCGRDKLAKVWDTTGKQIATTEAFSDLALRCALAGERLIAADWSGDIRVYTTDGKKLGGLTSNPPGIAEQLALTEKTAAETQAALPALQKAVADTEARVKADADAAAAKQKADLAAAEQRKKDLQAGLETAKAAPANAQKTLDAAKATLAAEEAGLAAAKKTVTELEAAGAPARDKLDAAKAAVTDAQQKLEKARQRFQESQGELAKTQAKTPARIAESEKALQAVQAEIQRIQQPPAPATPPPPTAAQAALTKAKADLATATTTLATAQAGVARWKRAQTYQTVFNAKQAVADKQAKYEDLLATAKDAFRQVELAKQGIAAADKTVADGPKTIAEKEQQFAKAKQAADAAKAAVDAAEKAIADKKAAIAANEAEFAEATKTVADLAEESKKRNEARAKLKDGTPEYVKANEAVQVLKADIAKADAALAAAKAKQPAKPGENPIPADLAEAAKKAQLELKLATVKVVPAEKALAAAKQEVEDARKQGADLKSKLAQFERDAVKTKADAEKAAVVCAKELEAAKAEAERLRAQYEAAKAASQKAAQSAVPVPPKS